MAFRAATSNSSTASTTGSVAVPAGAAAGDIAFLLATVDDSAATYSWPSGFTQLDKGTLTLDGESAAVAWKRLTGGDSGTYTMAASFGVGSTQWGMHCVLFSGRDATNPPVISTRAFSNASNAPPVTVTANGVTAVLGDDLWWLGVLDVTVASTTGVWTMPSGYTNATTIRASFEVSATGYIENVAAGATGSVAGSWTETGEHAAWEAWLVRVPASGGGGSRGLFRTPPGSGLGIGGSFFRDPLQAA